MKKLFTLTSALLFAVVMFAAAPTVTINTSSTDFIIQVDGKTYTPNGNTIRLTNISNGSHTIKVFKRGTGIFRTRREISSETFNVSNNDVRINVDRNGNIIVRERSLRSQDRNIDNNSDRRSRGNGNKYGHDKEWKKYKKNGKNKKDKDWDDDDHDDDDNDDDSWKRGRENSGSSDDNRWKRTNRRNS